VNRWRILVVDDDEDTCDLIRMTLDHEYDVLSLTNPLDTPEVLDLFQPDLIILDVMMPRRDGWEVLETLRASEEGRRTRIIVCSIINDPQLAVALGADAFLHKPVDRARLLNALTQVLAPPASSPSAPAMER